VTAAAYQLEDIMRKLAVVVGVVVAALAAGIARADAKSVKSIARMDALVICGMKTNCAWCDDKKDCNHGGAIACPKKGDCKKVTWIGIPPKHVKLLSKAPSIDLNKAPTPQPKMRSGVR
jgi:hypothetical protein